LFFPAIHVRQPQLIGERFALCGDLRLNSGLFTLQVGQFLLAG
jgi:hypothetical protein